MLVRTCVAVVFVRERVAVPATEALRVAAVRALELSTRGATLVRFCVAAVIRSFVRTLVLPNVRDALFTLREETRVAAAPFAVARELVRIAAWRLRSMSRAFVYRVETLRDANERSG